jgi:putative inorganic carbon (hco3(-)) transporter
MAAKLKILNSKLLDQLGQWWKYSQMATLLDRLVIWRQGSNLIGVGLVGVMLLGLLVALPYLSNNQTGVIAGAIACIWLLLWLSDNRAGSSNWTPIHLPLTVYWAIASCATLLSPVKKAAADGWLKLTIYFLLFAVMNCLMRRSERRIKWRSLFVGAYLLTTMAVCMYGLQQWVLGAEELATWTDPTSELAGVTRVYSFLNNPNLLAGYLMPAVPLGLVGMLHWRSWGMKTAAAFVVIASAICIRETYSRGGFIGLCAEGLALVILLTFWWGHKLPKWSLPVTVGGISGLLALAMIAIPTVRSRFFSIFSGRGDSSNNFRLTVWTSVLDMIKHRPLLGIGPGNKAFNSIYPFYQRPGFSALGAYSIPLEISVETGLIGLSCYIWLIGVAVQQGWRSLERLRRARKSEGLWIIGALSAIAGLMAHGIVDTVWYRPQVQILWWLILAIIASFSIPETIPEEISEEA